MTSIVHWILIAAALQAAEARSPQDTAATGRRPGAADSAAARRSGAPDAIVGRWLTQNAEGTIEIFGRDGKYFGRAVGGGDSLRLDANNPDERLRGRRVRSILIIRDLAFDGEDEWEDGTIYDPNTGKTYSCTVSLDGPDVLRLRGYLGISLFGRTVTWTRVRD